MILYSDSEMVFFFRISSGLYMASTKIHTMCKLDFYIPASLHLIIKDWKQTILVFVEIFITNLNDVWKYDTNSFSMQMTLYVNYILYIIILKLHVYCTYNMYYLHIQGNFMIQWWWNRLFLALGTKCLGR